MTRLLARHCRKIRLLAFTTPACASLQSLAIIVTSPSAHVKWRKVFFMTCTSSYFLQSSKNGNVPTNHGYSLFHKYHVNQQHSLCSRKENINCLWECFCYSNIAFSLFDPVVLENSCVVLLQEESWLQEWENEYRPESRFHIKDVNCSNKHIPPLLPWSTAN